MYATIAYELGKARIADMHHEAERDALARAARRSRRQPAPRRGLRAPWLPAVLARRARPVLAAPGK